MAYAKARIRVGLLLSGKVLDIFWTAIFYGICQCVSPITASFVRSCTSQFGDLNGGDLRPAVDGDFYVLGIQAHDDVAGEYHPVGGAHECGVVGRPHLVVGSSQGWPSPRVRGFPALC